ncbi:hypothetical protein [Anaerotignum sp.]|uniref:hypothetical protein n=1 Tax=Anaerotignum sp. TaxID=2039241 RepID=UPI0028AAC276|nr:hypothetical protein [Anaerotignum sp.]
MAFGKLISSVAKAAVSAAKKYSSNKKSSTSSSSGSSGGGKNSGYFDQNKDYASAINGTTDAAERARLTAERQNKLDWMNGTGQNKNGYSNNIYSNGSASSSGKGGTGALDMNRIKKNAMDSSLKSTLAAMEQNSQLYSIATDQEQAKLMAENQAYTEQLKRLGVMPFQKDGKFYYNRMDEQNDAQKGAYSGDSSLSLPDLALMRQYQTAYNDAKSKGDNTAMAAAHQMAEKLRDNYRYYPTKNSNGYGLGENDIGFIQDMTARVDDLGNRYVDEYNRNSVTTKAYDANGNLSYTHTGGNIDAHKAREAAAIARTNNILAAQGKANDTYAVRLSDPKDLNLSNEALRSQYGMSGGLMNYNGDYYRPQAEQERGLGLGGYDGIASSLADARNAQLKQTLAQLDQEKSQGNLNYDELARQAYIASRQSQVNLPQQLAAMGISGGASESAQLGLSTSYQNNLNSNEQARQQMLQQYANSALMAKLQADSDIGGYYADAQQAALAARQQQQTQDQAYNQWLQQFNYQQHQDSLDREWQQKQYTDSLSQYQTGLKQYELEMALKLGDYDKLAAAGYDVSALKQAASGGSGRRGSGSSKNTTRSAETETQTSIGNKSGSGWVFVPGFGQLSNADLLKYVNNGAITETQLPDGKGNITVYYTAKR